MMKRISSIQSLSQFLSSFSTNVSMQSLVLTLAFFIVLTTAWFSLGYNQSDEHFQVLEFAGLKLGHNQPSDLAWEYHERMRPTFQPAIAYVLCRFLSLLGVDNPFTVAFILRLISGLFYLTAAYQLYRSYQDQFENRRMRELYLVLTFLLWFTIFNSVRFSSENWSGIMMVLAVAVYIRNDTRESPPYFLLGVLFGLSYLFRYQMIFVIFGFLLWLIFIRKISFSNLIIFGFGGICCFIVGVFIDTWFYGDLTLSAWNYFSQNILFDKISSFGVSPWHHYFYLLLLKAIPPFSLIFILLPMVYFFTNRRDVLTWMIIPFFLVHFSIGHKELRFFYPLIGLLPILMMKGGLSIQKYSKSSIFGGGVFRFFYFLFWIQNGILVLFVMFYAPTEEVLIYRYLYDHYPGQRDLLYKTRDPFEKALKINFYRYPGELVGQKVENIDQIRCVTDQKCLLALEKPLEYYSSRSDARLIYSSYPAWITSFNFNGWLDRTHWWRIYEINSSN